MSKTHYRKVFKSDHLGVADLEDIIESGGNLVFTIKQVRQEQGTVVAGRKINANIAYFEEPIKPLVLNATNSKTVKNLANGSPFVEDWAGLRVELYIDPSAMLKGEIVGGVRVSPRKVEKPELTPGSNNWDNAIAAYKRDGNLDKVLERVTISPANQKKIKDAANVA